MYFFSFVTFTKAISFRNLVLIFLTENMGDTWKIVVLSLILILKPVFVQAGVHTFRVDEHEKVCFGYYLEQDSGEASGDMQVRSSGIIYLVPCHNVSKYRE